ncbi:MAG: hypothetical protein AB7S44_00715 [Spirochaetales bacterium]
MIIGVDIDDTLSDIYRLKRRKIGKYLKDNKLKFKLINKNTNFVSKMFDWPDTEWRKFWCEHADKMLSTAKPRRNVAKVLKKLHDEGNKILIITARTTEWHKDPYKLSSEWLDKNGIVYDELLVGYESKTDIVLEKKVDFFIDDQPANVEELSKYNLQTALMCARQNKNYVNEKVLRFRNWNQVYRYLKSIKA